MGRWAPAVFQSMDINKIYSEAILSGNIREKYLILGIIFCIEGNKSERWQIGIQSTLLHILSKQYNWDGEI